MTFFQNLFLKQFDGNWLLADRHHIPKFTALPNHGRGDEIVTVWNEGPYDVDSGSTDADGNSKEILEVVFALRDHKNWATLQIDVSASATTPTAATPAEIVTALNADATFFERFEAKLRPFFDSGLETADSMTRITIRQRKPITEMIFYINNGRAEESLRFNARAGVVEMPTYFSRHAIANRFDFEDSQNALIELDPVANTVDADIIDNAVNRRGVSLNLDSSTVRDDWELLEGKSGLFQFTNDLGGGVTVIFHAGAKVGDLAKKIIVVGADTFEIPHTLEVSDLITPP